MTYDLFVLNRNPVLHYIWTHCLPKSSSLHLSSWNHV